MKRKFEDKILAEQTLIENEIFFLMVKEVLGGVILYKQATRIVKNLSPKLKKWERYGIVKTYTIAGNKLIALQKNKFLHLSYTPQITHSLINRSCLRLDKLLNNGFNTPEKIYTRAMKGGDRAAFGGHFMEEVLTRQKKALEARGINLNLINPENISNLEKLKGRNIFFDGIFYNVDENKSKTILKPTFSYYILFNENKLKIAKELYNAYLICQSIFSNQNSNIEIKPRIRIYMYRETETLKNAAYKILSGQPEFRGHPEIIEATFTFMSFNRPFTYIDIQNIV